MLDFFKTLFISRNERVTAVLWDDNAPDDPKAYGFVPKYMFIISAVIAAFIVLATILIFRFTPLGMIILNYDEYSLRNDIVHITQRVIALQDSLDRREAQLRGIQDVIINRLDTTFTVGATRDFYEVGFIEPQIIPTTGPASVSEFLNVMALNFETARVESPGFPVDPPARGTYSKFYDPATRHFGVDIAANVGAPVRVIADGVVLHAEWTLNYGFVVIVQHTRGFVTVYKHMDSPLVLVGDFVQKGAILASVSNSGLLSSGPHVHFELWRNGQPVDPVSYLLD
jgi:murein DD-endopeptidase MepM/ murein hydrolase activator NlpD